jgi:predicted nucleic acid-binding protein
MKGKVFIDTNIWIYLYSDDKKSLTASKIVESNFKNVVISTQVLNEFFNVIACKHKIKKKEKAKDIIKDLIENFSVSIVDNDIILKAIDITTELNYSYFDSLMIATALADNCSILYTEDMHNGQVIEKTLTIVNPFK